MSAVDWSGFREPFRRIGTDFARMLPALCRGDPVPPPRQLLSPPSPESFEWIAERRKKLGISQFELARLAKCDRTTISTYERGRCQPKPKMRERLAAILLPPEFPP